MTRTIEVIHRLSSLGVSIQAEGQKLVITLKSKVPADLVVLLPQLKPEIMNLLGRMCFCQPPMALADIERTACPHCGIACWCITCNGCGWCSLRARWRDDVDWLLEIRR